MIRRKTYRRRAPSKRKRAPVKVSHLETAFWLILLSLGLQKQFKRQYKFCPTRRFMADFCDPANRVIVECQGGAFVGGRHTRGAGYVKDCKRFNIAQTLGYRVLQYTTKTSMQRFAQDYAAILSLNGTV